MGRGEKNTIWCKNMKPLFKLPLSNERLQTCLFIGIMFAIMFIAVWYLTLASLGTASFMLYGNRFVIPFWSTITIVLISMITLLSYTIWVPYVENLIEQIMDVDLIK